MRGQRAGIANRQFEELPLRIEPELNQLETKRAELKKELENAKAAIDCHKSNLAQIPNAIKKKK